MNHQRTIIIQSIRKSLNTFVEIAILELQRKISIFFDRLTLVRDPRTARSALVRHKQFSLVWSAGLKSFWRTGPDRLVRVDQLLGPWIPDPSYIF